MLTDCERNLPHGKKMNIKVTNRNKKLTQCSLRFVHVELGRWLKYAYITTEVCLSKADWIAKTLKQTLIPCFCFLLYGCFDMADALLYLLAAPHSDNGSIDDLRRCSCCCFVFRSVFFLLEITSTRLFSAFGSCIPFCWCYYYYYYYYYIFSEGGQLSVLKGIASPQFQI